MYDEILPRLFSLRVSSNGHVLVYDIYRCDLAYHAKLNRCNSLCKEAAQYPDLIQYWKLDDEHESSPHPEFPNLVAQLRDLLLAKLDKHNSPGPHTLQPRKK
ncbi:MAG: hypothetical protein EOO46_10800 [Flavobacterium sp.]|nr:MAG: hypothetical protein EOO46_10800 [Flavobacterium sp.]